MIDSEMTVTGVRGFIQRRLVRLPTTLIDLGSWFTVMGKMMRVIVEEQTVRMRAQRRMRGEGLVRGRDDARARAIAAEELARYRAEFEDDSVKIAITPSEAVDPWRNFQS